MAIKETIVTGRKFRKCIDEINRIWQRISFWTKACDVEFDDGKTAEEKLGKINSITDSLDSISSNTALSAAAGNNLQNQVTQIKNTINNLGTQVTMTLDGTTLIITM